MFIMRWIERQTERQMEGRKGGRKGGREEGITLSSAMKLVLFIIMPLSGC